MVGNELSTGSSVEGSTLPRRLTSFVGRDAEIGALLQLIGQARLVTITGAGGCGKTRLGIEVAAAAVASFNDGAWFCDLAERSFQGHVLQSLAHTLGVQESPARNLETAVCDVLRLRSMLLVFDNCEDSLAEVRDVVSRLVRECPEIRFLATSRLSLGLEGEVAWRLPSLSLPPADAPDLENRPGDALRLFVARTRERAPELAWEPRQLALAADICRLVDGIPLAIELAAAQMDAMSLQNMQERLLDGLQVLERERGSPPSRQQTLLGTMTWSYDLLSARERALFRRLGVFAGGWTLATAEAVCSDRDLPSGAVLDALSGLVERSMVMVEHEPDGRLRYRLLEPLRHFARQQLAASDEEAAIAQAHGGRFVALAERLESLSRGPRQVEAMDELAAEHGNLRAALGWCAEQDTDSGARLVAALALFWHIRGFRREAAHWADLFLALLPGDHPLRGRVLLASGLAVLRVADPQQALAIMAKTVETERQHGGDTLRLAEALCWQGLAYERAHDAEGARRAAVEAGALLGEGDHWQHALRLRVLAHAEKVATGDMICVNELHRAEREEARRAADNLLSGNVLNCLAEYARWEAKFELAGELYNESLALRRALGDRTGIVQSLVNMGMLRQQTGDRAGALESLREALIRSEQVGTDLYHHSILMALGGVAASMDRQHDAARLLGMADGTNPAGGWYDPPDRQVYESARARAEQALGTDEFQSLWIAGVYMPPERAWRWVREWAASVAITPPADDGGAAGLSSRELEVLGLMARGLSNRDIANRLVLSVRTVESHVANVCGKLGTRSRGQAVAEALHRGLVSPEEVRSAPFRLTADTPVR